jgi:hypothetical protein
MHHIAGLRIAPTLLQFPAASTESQWAGSVVTRSMQIVDETIRKSDWEKGKTGFIKHHQHERNDCRRRTSERPQTSSVFVKRTPIWVYRAARNIPYGRVTASLSKLQEK